MPVKGRDKYKYFTKNHTLYGRNQVKMISSLYFPMLKAFIHLKLDPPTVPCSLGKDALQWVTLITTINLRNCETTCREMGPLGNCRQKFRRKQLSERTRREISGRDLSEMYLGILIGNSCSRSHCLSTRIKSSFTQSTSDKFMTNHEWGQYAICLVKCWRCTYPVSGYMPWSHASVLW